MGKGGVGSDELFAQRVDGLTCDQRNELVVNDRPESEPCSWADTRVGCVELHDRSVR